MVLQQIQLSLLFTASQLIKYSMHIGVNHRNVNRSNSYYLLGIYRNISIINLSKIMPLLKKKFFFFFKFMKKSYGSVLLANSLPMKYSLPIRKSFEIFNISYFFGRWWNGFIKNYKIFSKPRNTLENNINIPKLPHFGFHVPLNDNYNDVSGYAFSAEFESVAIHSLAFFDSHKNIGLFKTGVMLSTKTLLNNYFLTYLIFSVLSKINFIKRKDFYLGIINNLKIEFHDEFEENFNKKYKFFLIKNFFKNWKKQKYWNNILFEYAAFIQKKKHVKNFLFNRGYFFKEWKDFLK